MEKIKTMKKIKEIRRELTRRWLETEDKDEERALLIITELIEDEIERIEYENKD